MSASQRRHARRPRTSCRDRAHPGVISCPPDIVEPSASRSLQPGDGRSSCAGAAGQASAGTWLHRVVAAELQRGAVRADRHSEPAKRQDGGGRRDQRNFVASRQGFVANEGDQAASAASPGLWGGSFRFRSAPRFPRCAGPRWSGRPAGDHRETDHRRSEIVLGVAVRGVRGACRRATADRRTARRGADDLRAGRIPSRGTTLSSRGTFLAGRRQIPHEGARSSQRARARHRPALQARSLRGAAGGLVLGRDRLSRRSARGNGHQFRIPGRKASSTQLPR